jgi:hypothetical protein
VEANAHQAPKSGPQETPGLATVRLLLTGDEQGELEIVRKLAKVMDELITIPGTKIKFGLDPIIGLIPGVGDLGSAAIGAYIIRAANRLGVPAVVQARMLLNLLIDTLIGVVPIVGDYLDVLYKANAKNAILLQRAVENREATGRSSWLLFIGMITAFIVIVVGGIAGTVFLVKWAWTHTG